MVPTQAGEFLEVAAAGVRLRAQRWRAREPRGVVLLLHGGGQTRHSWGAAGPVLAQAGWDAVAYDTRGHGDSGWAEPHAYGIDHLVADLQAVVGATCDGPPVLVGASMGGLTSLIAEGERPGTARALVLVDIVPRIEPVGVERITSFMHGAPHGFGSLEEVAEAVRAYNPLRERPVDVEGLRKNVRRREDGRWYWHWDPAMMAPRRLEDVAGHEDRLAAAARAVRVPTLLLHGEQSDVVSDEGVAEMLALVPSARAARISGAGHMVAGDDNSVFARDVVPFLSELPDVGARGLTPRPGAAGQPAAPG